MDRAKVERDREAFVKIFNNENSEHCAKALLDDLGLDVDNRDIITISAALEAFAIVSGATGIVIDEVDPNQKLRKPIV